MIRPQQLQRPRYSGPRDSRTGEVLPPPGYERETGIPAQDFDSEAWLAENGYAREISAKQIATKRAAKREADRTPS